MSTNDYHFKGQFINEFFLQKAALLISGKQYGLPNLHCFRLLAHCERVDHSTERPLPFELSSTKLMNGVEINVIKLFPPPITKTTIMAIPFQLHMRTLWV